MCSQCTFLAFSNGHFTGCDRIFTTVSGRNQHMQRAHTNYVRKELYTSLLNAEQSAAQRDHLVQDLYAILFAFVVETTNHKIAPNDRPPPTQIILLDHAGYRARGSTGTGSMAFTGTMPLVSALGQNGFDEFCINFSGEVVHSYVLRNVFENAVGYND
jgi:chitin synthase